MFFFSFFLVRRPPSESVSGLNNFSALEIRVVPLVFFSLHIHPVIMLAI